RSIAGILIADLVTDAWRPSDAADLSSRSAMSSVRRFALAPPSRLRARTAAQWFCLVVGVLLALRGAQQLLAGAGFNTPGEGWRASQQLLTALLLLLGRRTQTGARLVLIPAPRPVGRVIAARLRSA